MTVVVVLLLETKNSVQSISARASRYLQSQILIWHFFFFFFFFLLLFSYQSVIFFKTVI